MPGLGKMCFSASWLCCTHRGGTGWSRVLVAERGRAPASLCGGDGSAQGSEGNRSTWQGEGWESAAAPRRADPRAATLAPGTTSSVSERSICSGEITVSRPGLGFSAVEVHAGAAVFRCGSSLNFPTSSGHRLKHELWFKFCLSYTERATGLNDSFGEAQLGDTGPLNSVQCEPL